MNTIFPKRLGALGFTSLILGSSLQANQLNEFSVFQPTKGISANIYIDNSSVMIEPSNTKAITLKTIKPEYLKRYADKLYQIKDIDLDGTIDIATLDRVNQEGTRFCYKVYSYQLSSQQYSLTPSYTECHSASGTVVYATSANIATK